MPGQDDGLDPKFRMPRTFGYAPGPRNLPAAHRHLQYRKELVSYTVSALTDPEQLARMLPERLALDGDACLELVVMSFSNIGWLAGRGYDILMVRIPARWRENGETVSGYFVPVVWENMADPIITGREELGWPKIFADIAVSEPSDAQWRASASWGGHCFFDCHAAEFEEATTCETARPMVFEKFVPATGEPEAADACYLTVTQPDGPEPQVRSVAMGKGSFAFHSASWEQMPTQYPIANALAALPLADFSPVSRAVSSGGGDGSGQRKLAD